MKIFVTPKVLSQDGFPNTFGFTLSLTWAYLGVLETKQSVSFCTYVRLAVKITQLLKDKLCANIPGRINILIPLFFFSFCCLVFTQLDHSVKECFTQQLSGPRSPQAHLQHPPDPCPALTDKFHYPRSRMSPDFNPTRKGRNVIP